MVAFSVLNELNAISEVLSGTIRLTNTQITGSNIFESVKKRHDIITIDLFL